MGFNGFNGVMRTRWPEAAWGGLPIAHGLIKTNGLQHGLLWRCEVVGAIMQLMGNSGHCATPAVHLAISEPR
jgi:hypothetical protein